MTNEDVALFHQAEALANSGQTQAAHQLFCTLQERNPAQVEILFWIAVTSPSLRETRHAIEAIRRIQPNHPRLYALERQYAKLQRDATRLRIACVLYLCAVAFILIRDIPRGTINTMNTLAIICVVLFNLVLVVNIVRQAVKRVFTTWSALYIAALMGFFMAPFMGNSMDVPNRMVFGVSLLFVAVYTVVLAVRSIVTGRV